MVEIAKLKHSVNWLIRAYLSILGTSFLERNMGLETPGSVNIWKLNYANLQRQHFNRNHVVTHYS